MANPTNTTTNKPTHPTATRSHLLSPSLVPIVGEGEEAARHLSNTLATLESMGFQKKERGFVSSWNQGEWFQFRHKNELEIVLIRAERVERDKPWSCITPYEGMVARPTSRHHEGHATHLVGIELQWMRGDYLIQVLLPHVQWRRRAGRPATPIPHLALPDGTSVVVSW